jgi:hypothetical protein
MISIHLSTDRHHHVATATIEGKSFKASEAKRSPIHVLARTLVSSGLDAATVAQIYRDGTAILRNPMALASWTDRDVTDGDTGGLRVHAYRPFNGIGDRDSQAA